MGHSNLIKLNFNVDPFRFFEVEKFHPQVTDDASSENNSQGSVNSMKDVTRMISSGAVKTRKGLLNVTKYLVGENSGVKLNGGIMDQSGKDGLQADEVLAYPGTPMAHEQSARSAAGIWLRHNNVKCNP